MDQIQPQSNFDKIAFQLPHVEKSCAGEDVKAEHRCKFMNAKITSSIWKCLLP